MSRHHAIVTTCDFCGKRRTCAVFHDSVVCGECETDLDSEW